MQAESLTRKDMKILTKQGVVTVKRTISSNAAKFLSKAALSVAKSNANQVCRLLFISQSYQIR